MLYIMYLVLSLVDVILDVYLDLGHHQIQLIAESFIAYSLLFDSRD